MHSLTISDLGFNMITLAVVWRMDTRSEKVHSGSPLRGYCNNSSARYGQLGLA